VVAATGGGIAVNVDETTRKIVVGKWIIHGALRSWCAMGIVFPQDRFLHDKCLDAPWHVTGTNLARSVPYIISVWVLTLSGMSIKMVKYFLQDRFLCSFSSTTSI
jgi:hypothetical protein